MLPRHRIRGDFPPLTTPPSLALPMPALEALFSDHLRVMTERMTSALVMSGFDAVAIHAGRAPTQFLDDQSYPFKVNPHFKAWIPVVDAPDSWLLFTPGSRLKVVFLQPNDYWYAPPGKPAGYWIEHTDLVFIREP